MSAPWYTNIDSLRADGFGGFCTFQELGDCRLECVPADTGGIGVYVVVRPDARAPGFLSKSTGSTLTRRGDPSVPVEELAAKWVDGAQVIYIGKAGSPQNPWETLAERIRQFVDFGAGEPVDHWDGRYIWQLAAAEDLVVCWKETPNEEPADVAGRMIGEFKEAYGGRLPFANLSE